MLGTVQGPDPTPTSGKPSPLSVLVIGTTGHVRLSWDVGRPSSSVLILGSSPSPEGHSPHLGWLRFPRGDLGGEAGLTGVPMGWPCPGQCWGWAAGLAGVIL